MAFKVQFMSKVMKIAKNVNKHKAVKKIKCIGGSVAKVARAIRIWLATAMASNSQLKIK